jgi:Protein of unknown function (DUF2846)
MGWVGRAVVACFMTLALAACATATTAPTESQSKQKDARLARLYFVFPHSMMLRTNSYEVKVDGQSVGKLVPDSYMFVDRQPGTHTLKVEPPMFDFAQFETEVQVAAGGTYYYAISVRPPPGAFYALLVPNVGTPIEPKGGGISFASVKLNSLDPATAAAEMAKLDAQ